jgi:ParB family transcriptional regulator, chromosome partitioning protein
MSNQTTTPAPNKKRLGRGLGSLLGGGFDISEPQPVRPTPAQDEKSTFRNSPEIKIDLKVAAKVESKPENKGTSLAPTKPDTKPETAKVTTNSEAEKKNIQDSSFQAKEETKFESALEAKTSSESIGETAADEVHADFIKAAKSFSQKSNETQATGYSDEYSNASDSAGYSLGEYSKPAVSTHGVDTHVTVAETLDTQTKPQGLEYSEKSLNQVWTISVEKLIPNRQQPRQEFDQEKLKELSNSIRANGILQPIVARRKSENEFEIIAGERRWRAAQLAGLLEVPVILRSVTEQVSLELAIVENIQRADLNSLEEAEAFERLMLDYDLTQQVVSERMGRDRSSIANSLRLLTLPTEVKIMLRASEISAGHAKVLLSMDSAVDQTTAAKEISSQKLSVRATEKLVARMRLEKKAAIAFGTKKSDDAEKADEDVDLKNRLVVGLSSELQKLLGTKVTIDYTLGKGRVAIQYYSDEQLSQIVEKLRVAWEN